jgi:curved DNA-binding protein CbpA/MinD-like ATPase involved in chromosome partitioning or flagellar assembly
MSSTDLENVASRSWRAGTLPLDVEPAKPHEQNVFTTDYYEILRVGPQADEETIERVYRTLADRFHPDNPGTGDPETFLRLGEAWETLSNPAKRAKYNVLRQRNRDSARFWLRGREFFDGVRGGQNRRLAVLCLLYRQRISAPDSPGLTILDLERLTGCTREEITSALWYLCEKEWGTIADSSACSITAGGFDVVESQLEDRLEFRALATVCYYGLPSELKDREHVEFRFWKDTLPLYLEPGREIEGDVSIADHYEILGIGPKADEEVIERVYRTLAGRFHPDNPSTGDANTFLRVTEAYNVLSNQGERARYDALRERTKYSGRFRLRGRDFFYGIKGEQLRRLAVLCLLYRQAVSEWPGLTVLDLEQLTGCTREELTSALWYLREKKWAKYGEYTQYSITVVGFDVVENAAQTAAQNQQNAAVTLQSPISNTIAPENRNSHWIAESERTDIEAEEAPANAEAGQEPISIEEAPGFAEQGTRFEGGAEPAAQNQQNVAGTPQYYPVSNTAISPENYNFQRLAESGRTDIQYKTFLSHISPRYRTPPSPPGNGTSQRMAENERTDIKAGEPSENVEAAQGPTPIEEAPGLVEQAQSEVGAEPAARRQQSVAVTPQSAMSNTIAPEHHNSHRIAESEPTDIKAEEPLENVEVAQGSIPIKEASGIPEQVTRFEDGTEPEERETDRSWAWLYPEDTYGNEFEHPCQACATQAAEQSLRNFAVALQSPTSDTIAPENHDSHRIAESEQMDIKTEEPSGEQLAVARGAAPIKEAPGPAEQGSQFEDGAQAQEREAANSWAWLAPEDAHGDESVSPQASTAQTPAHRTHSETPQPNVKVPSQSPGVIMSNSKTTIAEQTGGVAVSAGKRVILSMGGKGGVGKTSVMTGLAEWFEENRIPVTMLDLDLENKACGSLTHFFGGRVPKINIHTPAGLDAFVDNLAEDAPVILADMGAGAGQITHDWFEKMYPDVAEAGVAFTAIGVVTSDPASVESVLHWATALQDRVSYVIAMNNLTEHTDFTYWRESDQAQEFQKRFQPAIIRLDYRLADLENAVRNYGVTLGQVANRTASAPELRKASLVMRAQSYRRRMFAEFDTVKELLLP